MQGVHMKLSTRPDIIARLASFDVNMPKYSAWPFPGVLSDHNFEAAIYDLLRSEANIRVSRMIYHRIPLQHQGPRTEVPRDILGRGLILFEKAAGENNVWNDLDAEQKVSASI